MELEKYLNPFRFAIGPWKSHYSDVWRIWFSADKGDIYLGASAILKWLKVSLHNSGQCHIAFVDHNYEELRDKGKAPKESRFVAQWDIGAFKKNEIKQILDIHFPLKSLHHNEPPKGTKRKKMWLLEPQCLDLVEADTVTIKFLVHKIPLEEIKKYKLFESKGIHGIFSFEREDYFVSIAYRYNKILPIDLDKTEVKIYEKMIYDTAKEYDLKIGEKKENLTVLHPMKSDTANLVVIHGVCIARTGDTSYDFSINEL